MNLLGPQRLFGTNVGKAAFRWWFVVSSLALLNSGRASFAASLSRPEIDSYNVRVGTQTFAGLYQFTTNTLLVETAEAIRELGSDIMKGYLGPDFPRQYHISLPVSITNLVSLAQNEPSCRRTLDMSFRHFILWVYPFGEFWPFDGYSKAERSNEYRQIRDLATYLLTNYNNSGKTFYLGHWEGDWYLLPGYNVNTNPSPMAMQGMIDWLNTRQQAIDDARQQVPHTNVDVFCYAEVNRVRDAIVGGANVNQRMINRVVPYITNLDFISWSAYDGMDLNPSDLVVTFDYLNSKLPSAKENVIPGRRIWIGEYGWGTLTTDQQEPKTRTFISRALNWGPRFLLFWEIYNNEPNRHFCLIDSNETKVPTYYLHRRFIKRARLAAARFLESEDRLPNDLEFWALMSPLLDEPLTPLVSLRLTVAEVADIAAREATCICQLTQGVYGDEQAMVRVSWGTADSGTEVTSWQHTQSLGLNTNFIPATFRATLQDLLPDTEYFVRFSATNAAAAAWSPASIRFRTMALEPPPAVSIPKRLPAQ